MLCQVNPTLLPRTDVPGENPQEGEVPARKQSLPAAPMANLVLPQFLLVPHSPGADSEERALPAGHLLRQDLAGPAQQLFREESISPTVQRQPHTLKPSQASLGTWGIRKSLPRGTCWCRDASSVYATMFAARREALLLCFLTLPPLPFQGLEVCFWICSARHHPPLARVPFGRKALHASTWTKF